jgi:carboxypeptidase Q
MSPSRRAVSFAVAASTALALLARADDLPSAPPAGPRPTSGPTTAAVDPVIGRIRDEGLNHSHVVDTLDYLCNVIGQRLTGSPGQRHASEWTRDQLAAWGLSDAHLEPWGPFGRGWQLDRYALQVTAPYAIILHGEPKAWSPGTPGPIEADVVYIDATTRAGLQKYRGQLKGKIVLLGTVHPTVAHFEAVASRMDDDRLAKLVTSRPTSGPAAPSELLDARSRLATAAGPATLPGIRPAGSQPPTAAANFFGAAVAFAQAEGAALVLDPSVRGDGGTIFVAQATVPSLGDPPTRPAATGPTTRPRAWSPNAPAMPPQVTLADEDFNRLVSLAKHGEHLRIAANLAVRFTPADQVTTCNTVAEIPGTDLRNQIVMVGGHLDSWQSGTGATDNGAGAACAMEAIRIIRALDLHPRRTIRVALWTGEEEGLLGSAAYVKQHFGYLPDDPAGSGPASRPVAAADFSNPGGDDGGANNPATRPAAAAAATQPTTRRLRRRRRPPGAVPTTAAVFRLPDYERLSVYFNLDNGTGRIRGIYAQGNPAAVPIFHRWLAPFADLSAATVTLANTGSTDHISFDRIGLPGFQFIQDPIEYFPRTHHSNADVFDRIQADDVKEASTVMAALLWDAANADERFPRKPVERPTPPGGR